MFPSPSTFPQPTNDPHPNAWQVASNLNRGTEPWPIPPALPQRPTPHPSTPGFRPRWAGQSPRRSLALRPDRESQRGITTPPRPQFGPRCQRAPISPVGPLCETPGESHRRPPPPTPEPASRLSSGTANRPWQTTASAQPPAGLRCRNIRESVNRLVQHLWLRPSHDFPGKAHPATPCWRVVQGPERSSRDASSATILPSHSVNTSRVGPDPTQEAHPPSRSPRTGGWCTP